MDKESYSSVQKQVKRHIVLQVDESSRRVGRVSEPTHTGVEVYQLRIWIRHFSPQIWRRLLVHSDNTIVQLHDTLQIAFGWTDEHLHRFLIRGKPYGIGRSGGISFDDNPYQVRLRVSERPYNG